MQGEQPQSADQAPNCPFAHRRDARFSHSCRSWMPELRESLWYEIGGRSRFFGNNTAYKRILYKIHSVSYDLIISKVQMQY